MLHQLQEFKVWGGGYMLENHAKSENLEYKIALKFVVSKSFYSFIFNFSVHCQLASSLP